MTEEMKALIRETVRETVKELRSQGMTKDEEDANYRDVSEMLRDYYRNGQKDKQITYALQSLRFEPYFGILEKYYKHNEKMDNIASDFEVDISTVFRKKRELCLKLYRVL